MTFDYTISLGTLIQLGGIAVGGYVLLNNVKIHVEHLRDDLAKLATIPSDIARHDERLKFLEREKNK